MTKCRNTRKSTCPPPPVWRTCKVLCMPMGAICKSNLCSGAEQSSNTSKISPCSKACMITVWTGSTSKSKLTTSYMSVCCRPVVITHSPPLSTVVDLQTTRCIGAAAISILYQPQVTRTWSCVVCAWVMISLACCLTRTLAKHPAISVVYSATRECIQDSGIKFSKGFMLLI